jgi:DNA-binding NarL/FixJ family response regulator
VSMTEAKVDQRGDMGEIVVLNRDLFFGVKIGNILRGLGYQVTFVPATGVFVERLRAEGTAPVLGIIDMGAGVDWEAVATVTGEDARTPVLVFGSHLDVEGLRAAKAAGVRRVVSNGDFHRDMVALVRRYARREEHRAG